MSGNRCTHSFVDVFHSPILAKRLAWMGCLRRGIPAHFNSSSPSQLPAGKVRQREEYPGLTSFRANTPERGSDRATQETCLPSHCDSRLWGAFPMRDDQPAPEQVVAETTGDLPGHAPVGYRAVALPRWRLRSRRCEGPTPTASVLSAGRPKNCPVRSRSRELPSQTFSKTTSGARRYATSLLPAGSVAVSTSEIAVCVSMIVPSKERRRCDAGSAASACQADGFIDVSVGPPRSHGSPCRRSCDGPSPAAVGLPGR